MASSNSYDVVVLGSGPGGYVAAIRCAQLGMSVAVVEARELGGVCLNRGCIPTKALLKSSEVLHYAQNADKYGLKVKGAEADFAAVIKRSRDVAGQLSKGIGGLLKKNRIDVIKGYGKLVKGGVEVFDDATCKGTARSINASYIIVATGARARALKGFEPDGKVIWTYEEALNPPKLPSKLCVVGSGAIGSEFSNFYCAMGVKVTLVEARERVLPLEDEEVSGIMKKAFQGLGINVLTSAKLEGVKAAGNGVDVTINGKTDRFDAIIMAVGVQPNVENISLDGLGVKQSESGHILADKHMQTNVSNVFAIGDVTAGPWLAHKASHEGIAAAEKIASLLKGFDLSNSRHIGADSIPGCVYTMPQVASIGLTEKAARERGFDVKCGKFQAIGNGKSIATGNQYGFVKVVFDGKTGELLGAHMVGNEVTEMICVFALGKTLETTELELMSTVFPHPTVSEMIHEAVLDAFGRCIHM